MDPALTIENTQIEYFLESMEQILAGLSVPAVKPGPGDHG